MGHRRALGARRPAIRHRQCRGGKVLSARPRLPDPTVPSCETLTRTLPAPLDASKQTNSPNLKIIESNEAVESSVSGNTTIIGAGKSNPDAVAAEQGSSQEASVPETQPQVPEAQAKAPEVPEAPAAPETSVTPEAPEAPKAETKTPEAPAAEGTQRQNS